MAAEECSVKSRISEVVRVFRGPFSLFLSSIGLSSRQSLKVPAMSSLMSEAAIRLLLDARWGLPSSASALKLSPLPSYEDANWRAQFLGEESKGREDLVVKITARETREELEMQHGLLARLPLALAQRPIPTVPLFLLSSPLNSLFLLPND